MDETTDDFRREMLKLGIISYREQDTVWDIAKKCARTIGVPAAGAGLVMGSGAGAVTVPGIGAVPGALFGLLAGFGAGTLGCTAVNVRYRNDLRKLLDEQ